MAIRARVLVLASLLTWGLAARAAGQQAPAAAEPRLTLPVPFEQAVAKGSRTHSGASGPRYWQNQADYDIGVEISPRDSLLRGEETVTYHNRSPDTLTAVAFHLYQNLMGAFGAREAPAYPLTSGMVLDRVEAGGRPVVVVNTARDTTADSS